MMKRTGKLLRCLTAAMTVLLALLLCWHCVGLLLAGRAPENLDAAGLPLTPAFTAEKVGTRLMQLRIPAALWAVLILVTALQQCLAGREDRAAEASRSLYVSPKREEAGEAFPASALRIGLYLLAAMLIVLGVMNGGLYDVLVKAINICTECIGLG